MILHKNCHWILNRWWEFFLLATILHTSISSTDDTLAKKILSIWCLYAASSLNIRTRISKISMAHKVRRWDWIKLWQPIKSWIPNILLYFSILYMRQIMLSPAWAYSYEQGTVLGNFRRFFRFHSQFGNLVTMSIGTGLH